MYIICYNVYILLKCNLLITMAGIPTRVFEDVIFYGFLLGAGAIFIVGSSLFIPEIRDARNKNDLFGNIQSQINAIKKKIDAPVIQQISGYVPSGTSTKSVAPAAQKDTNNCKHVGGYTIWESSGCYNGKRLSKLAHNAGIGASCTTARAQFINKYRC